jgi:hypothetical protein
VVTAAELIALLNEQNQDAVVVIPLDDDYWQISDVDTAELIDPAATNPKWNYKVGLNNNDPYRPNAVRICM